MGAGGEIMDFETALENWRGLLQEMLDKHYAKAYSNLKPPTISFEPGSKYIRVVREEGDGVYRSVYCFIEKSSGDILKAASWKIPAKTDRGNIFNNNPLEGCNPYGVEYLKPGRK
jgi:hypothetical protein